MVVSTHSPVLLAGSRLSKEKTIWNVLLENNDNLNKTTTAYTDDEIKKIGEIMGDPNFYAYFLAANNEPLIFIEDSRQLTLDKYNTANIKITKGLHGVSEVVRFIDVFISAPFIVNNKIFFIIDNDIGKTELNRFYDLAKVNKKECGFSRFEINGAEKVYLIFLPENCACEHLFAEFEEHLKKCVLDLWDTNTWEINESSPTDLSGAAAKVRSKPVSTEIEATNLIKNERDIKNTFWKKVEKYNYKIKDDYITALNNLMT